VPTVPPPSGGSSSSPGRTSSTGLPEPCSLLATAKVAVFIGGTVKATAPTPQGCAYSNGPKELDLVVSAGTTSIFTADQANYTGKPLAGVGDNAFLTQPQSIVEFIKGTLIVRLQLNTALISSDDVSNLEDLARQAAAQIP
jgi:hypothetical protein